MHLSTELMFMDIEKAKKCGEYEVGWWMGHGRKDYKGFFRNMVSLYILQYGISRSGAEKAVNLRIRAAQQHDVAEELERRGQKTQANPHWEAAKNLLSKHFEYLP